ncbi:hypothetical protein GGR54DRAFT_636750 [Hypoxylon sp. NC1633]|nr:hypothetical protein GGR54DRAFT_636750 [Hypoxylon sp. NC1633]
MGTRNLICIRIHRQWIVAKYCQYDGYPTGQGVVLFNFLHVEGNIARLRAGLAHVYEPTQEELDKSNKAEKDESIRASTLNTNDVRGFWDTLPTKPGLSNLSDKLFPSLSRAVGGQILELIANATADHKLPIQSELEFAADWLYCEWAYIVDLDDERLKVFGRREPNYEGHPFEEVCVDALDVPKLMASFTFSELQTWDEETFMERVEDLEKEDQASLQEHNMISRMRLAANGIYMVGTSKDNTSKDGTTEDGTTGDGTTEDGTTEDGTTDLGTSVDDTIERDANKKDVNGDGADAVASSIDRLHLG